MNLTAQGHQSLRLERLRRVEGELDREISSKISRLHDHNGVLFVNWTMRPSPQEIEAVVNAWGRHENEPITCHYEAGVELVGAVRRYNPFEGSGCTHLAAMEHLRAARTLLKEMGKRMKKNGSGSQATNRIFQSLKLAEGALRHARRCHMLKRKEGIEGATRWG